MRRRRKDRRAVDPPVALVTTTQRAAGPALDTVLSKIERLEIRSSQFSGKLYPMRSSTPPEHGTAISDSLTPVSSAWYRMQVQHAHLLQHLAVIHDLNPIDLRLLKVLGVDHNPKTPKELGRFLEIGTGTVTAMIDRLETRGFVARRPNPNDRRSTLIHLAPAGTAVLHGLMQVYEKALNAVVTPQNRDAIIAAAVTLEQHLHVAAETYNGDQSSLNRD